MKRWVWLVAFCLLSVTTDAEAATRNVNCDQGQTIRAALAKLDRHGPNTVNVRGTCTEWVEVRNFEQLTLQGRPGAVIAAPSATPPAPLTGFLQVVNSRDVVVADLSVRASDCQSACGIHLLFLGCSECRVERTTVEGLTIVSGLSTLHFLNDVLQSSGAFAAFASYDNSHSKLVGCTVEPGAGGGGWWGAQLDSGSAVAFGGTTIRGHANGIGVMKGSILTIAANLPDIGADPTVVVESNWYRGIDVSAGSTADIIGNLRLQSNGDGGFGRVGIMVREASHATVYGGSRILDTGGNGLVALSNSTVTLLPALGGSGTPVEVRGSQAQDVFCEASAVVNGSSYLTGATKLTCATMNPFEEVVLPMQ
jgi:hypothetical protein